MRYPIATIWAVAVVTALAFGGWRAAPVAAQGAATPAACPATTPAENEALIRRWFDEVWHGGNADATDTFLADEVIRHNANADAEAERVTEDEAEGRYSERLEVDFPDLQVTVEEVVAEGDLVAARLVLTGTHSDDREHLPDLDTAATGVVVTWTAQAWYRIACGEIAELWWSSDEFGMLRQIGALPESAAGAAPVGDALPTASPAAGTPAACPTTTPEENKALVRRLQAEVLAARDPAAVDDLHAEDHSDNTESLGSPAGEEAAAAVHAEWFADFPQADHSFEAIIAEGDLVAARWRAETALAPGAEFFGIQGTGQAVTLTGMTMYRIACGEIAETWRNFDLLAAYLQLGGPTATPAA